MKKNVINHTKQNIRLILSDFLHSLAIQRNNTANLWFLAKLVYLVCLEFYLNIKKCKNQKQTNGLSDTKNATYSAILYIWLISESPWNSGLCTNISAKMQPIDQISIFGVYLLVPRRTSGDRYHKIVTLCVYNFWAISNDRAESKSVIFERKWTKWIYKQNKSISNFFSTFIMPLRVIKMFCGHKLRWKTRRWWQNAMPLTIWCK